MSVNKNNLSDIADYHEKIKFFEELFNLDYNPTEMLVTVERNGNVIYKEFTEVAVGKSKYDYTSVFKDVMIYFSDHICQELRLYKTQDPHYNKFEFDLAKRSLKITTRDNTTIFISNE
ncbi:Uncharacterised protein [Streptococcus pneumoniae]|nr:Uncharacterised protein [Streptococcus pneumoniae]